MINIFCPIHNIPLSVINGIKSCYVCEDIRVEEEGSRKFYEHEEAIERTTE